jgi:hypothetical protein
MQSYLKESFLKSLLLHIYKEKFLFEEDNKKIIIKQNAS